MSAQLQAKDFATSFACVGSIQQQIADDLLNLGLVHFGHDLCLDG